MKTEIAYTVLIVGMAIFQVGRLWTFVLGAILITYALDVVIAGRLAQLRDEIRKESAHSELAERRARQRAFFEGD